MQTDRLHNTRYLDWVKTSLSLLYLKEGVANFNDEKAAAFYGDVTEQVRKKTPRAVTTVCNTCTNKDVVKTKRPDKKNSTWTIHYQDNICNIRLEEILPHHCHLPLPNIAWANSDPKLWTTNAWEVAKLFQPFGCEKQKSAGDCDCSGLLTLMQNCRFFETFLTNKQLLQQIRDVRNACMHASDLELADSEMKKALDLMIMLLKEPALRNSPECIEAKIKITQLRDNSLDLSLNKELELRAINNRVTEIQADLDNLTAEHRNMHGVLNDITARQDSTKEEYSELRQRTEYVENQISEMKRNIESLTQITIPALGLQVTDIGSRVQVVDDRSRQDVQGLRDELETRLRATESQLDEMKDQTAGVDIIHVQQYLINLYERFCQRIPIYPLKPTWRKRVEDLYVKPNMHVDDPRGRRVKQDVHGNTFVHEYPATGIKVDRIEDIFYSNNELCKDVYISGEMGTGKTNLCEHLVSLWIRGQSGPRPLSEDESFMHAFKLLFYISLREARQSNNRHVQSMIASQLQLKEDDVAKLMKENKCLIISDGLDEFSPGHDTTTGRFRTQSLPERPLIDNCVYLTTSRPFKLELLTHELEERIDRQIALLGLESASQVGLAKNVVSLLNDEFCTDKDADEFIEKMEFENLSQYLETPVLHMQMLGLWFDGVPLGESLCAIYSSILEKQVQITDKLRHLSQDQEQDASDRYQLPDCFLNKPFCQKYKSILFKVSKLACERLFDKGREHALVFDHNETNICGMTDVEVKQLLKMGILTQHKGFGRVTEELKSISFVHKSHQEFFSAIHLSFYSDRSELCRLLANVIDTLDDALGLEKIFIFLCGMNIGVAAEISKCIMNKVSTDERVKNYRLSFGPDSSMLIERIQNVILSGSREARANDKSAESLEVHDICLIGSGGSEVFNCDTSSARSICMKSPGKVRLWPSSLCTEKIYLFDIDLVACEEFEHKFQANYLSMLHIYKIKTTHKQLDHLLERLSIAGKLNRVQINKLSCNTHENMQGECRIQLDFSKHVHLEKIQLSLISVGQIGSLTLCRETERLNKVRLWGLSISSDALKTAAETLPNNGALLELGDKWKTESGDSWLREPVVILGAQEARRAWDHISQSRDIDVLKCHVEYRDDNCVVNFCKFQKKRLDGR